MLSACSTFFPRMRSATSLPFWAESRTPRNFAVVFMSSASRLRRCCRCRPRCGRRCRCSRRRRRFPVRRRGSSRCSGLRGAGLGMALENAGMREFAQLVPHHVFSDIDGHMLLAVVHGNRKSHEIRKDGRTARPGLDWTLVVRLLRRFHLLYQMVIDERALLDRTCHKGQPPATLSLRRRMIMASVRLFLRVL